MQSIKYQTQTLSPKMQKNQNTLFEIKTNVNNILQ